MFSLIALYLSYRKLSAEASAPAARPIAPAAQDVTSAALALAA